ncbi:MAG: sulfatase-like hydrolase/transferase, partial [Verrucomicrobiota bacterium]
VTRSLREKARSWQLVLGVFFALTGMPMLQADQTVDGPFDVVIVLCDDLNPFYTGFGGDPDSITSNLDALARESAVFTRCYATSVVCMSSRTSLVTGLFPHSTGCWGNASDLFVSPRFTTLFSDLKASGYTTAMIGKTHWYAGQGFRDQFPSLTDYMEGIGIDFFQDVATTFSSRGGKGIYQDFLRSIGKFEAQSKDLTERLSTNQYLVRPSLLEPEETCDWMMTDLALEYLESTSTSEPFALMIGYSNPHSPFDPAGKYATMYEPESISLRENVEPFRKYGDEYDLAKVREARAAYLGKISFLDALLGRLVTGLQERGTWERTIFIFTADHGMAVGEHGNIAKGQFWEEVARVPMVMRVPGLTDEGLESDALVQLFDFYPTLIELAGGEVSPHVQARSFVPVLKNPEERIWDAVFSEIHHDNELAYLVRDHHYKWFVHRGEEALFDLKTDPFEQSNLIESSGHKEIAAQLRERLRIFLMEEQVNVSAGYIPSAERAKRASEEVP